MPWVSFTGDLTGSISARLSVVTVSVKCTNSSIFPKCKTEMLPIWRLDWFYVNFLDRSFCINYIANLSIHLLSVSFPLRFFMATD